MLIKNHQNLYYTRIEFAYLISALAFISIAAALCVVFCKLIVTHYTTLRLFIVDFQKEPKLPPSKAQHIERMTKESKCGFKQSLVALLKNKAYVMQIFAYGINIGGFVAVSTLLNQIVLLFFPVRLTAFTRVFYCLFSV